MTLEGKLQRIAAVLSFAALITGVLFTALLAAASAWSSHLLRQTDTQLAAQGCPIEFEDEHRAVIPTVEIVGPNRWLVILGDRSRSPGRWRPYRRGAYVVSANRQVTEVEILEIARASDHRESLDLARWHPSPGVEVIDCIMEGVELSSVHYKTALSARLINWWVRQGAKLGLRNWMNLFPISGPVFEAANLVSALMLTVIVAALPRFIFYLLRPIARRSTRNT